MTGNGLPPEVRPRWSAHLLAYAREASLLERFAPAKPAIPLTRRQRFTRALREIRRRLADAWAVLRHGERLS